MSQQSEHLDFSGLFKLDVLVQLDIASHSFYEVGLKKFLALSSNKELVFIYINSQSERFDNVYDWDFVDNPVFCMCFEPSGTWVLIVSDQKVLLVPFLPKFIPQNTFDCKWSLSSVTVLPLPEIPQPISVVWWLTKESENIVVIGSKSGSIYFYSLESQIIVGETKVPGEIVDLQICFDDSLDLLALLISKGPNQQWKLVLEHRSFGYNWLQQMRVQNDKEKKDGFMSYIKQLSKDKITFFTQGGSKDENKAQTVEYVLKPIEYLPIFRKNSNSWALTAQYVTGRHFLTAFELNEGIIILESPTDDTPSRTLRPQIKKDSQYIQGLWSQRLIYLVRKNELEIHSAQFSQLGEAMLGIKRDFTELWAAELIGDVQRAYLMSAKEPSSGSGGWKEPTFMCDLQLPRFVLEPCLVVTSCGAYVLNTVSEPCEWLVGLIMRGGAGAELSAAALGAPVPQLLRAAADMLMSRGKVAPAHYLFSLAQSQPDGWVARLGVFGRLHELSMYKQVGNVGSLGNAAIATKLLALLLKIGTNSEENFDMDVKLTTLTTVELQELTSIAAAIGLWDLVPVFSIHTGYPNLLLNAIKSKNDICRGAILCVLREQCLVPILLEENGQWFFDFVAEKCNKFDTIILKRLCLWLNPLQDQLRPVMRDLKQGLTSIYATRMLQLIATFMHVASAIESRQPCVDIHTDITQKAETWKNQFSPRRAVACGLAHWAVADAGGARVLGAHSPVDAELTGAVVDVACGRHHTLLLTENGIYAAGDNSFGQLGLGPAPDPHLTPQLVDLRNVKGKIARISAGWHHSCIVNNAGTLYSWGLNFDGQLGSGDRKQVQIPTEVKLKTDAPSDKSNKSPDKEIADMKTKALVACGGDFTIFIDDDGRIYATGNMHLQSNNEKDKTNNRVIMMKTTKRVIKIPASRSNNKFLFHQIDSIHIMFPFDIDGIERKPIEPRLNPLNSLADFKKKSWADDIILLLKPWINEEDLSGNLNMAAKLAYHRKMYSDCLKLMLDNLKFGVQDDQFYVTHQNQDDENITIKKDEQKIVITNIMSKRIKDISMSILNEEPYPIIDPNTYALIPCCCDELKYTTKQIIPKSILNIPEIDLSVRAAQIIDKSISIFPIDSSLWEKCFRYAKDFFIDNNLRVDELEAVLRKYMESNANTMAAAIMYSNDCAQYSEILSPKFYLNMCSGVLDTWG